MIHFWVLTLSTSVSQTKDYADKLTLKLGIDVVDNGFPAFFLIDLIAISDGIDNGQSEPHVALAQLVSVRLR